MTKPTESIQQPTEPLTVYRGAGVVTRGRGFSWTLSREVARIYAELLAVSGIAAGIFEATVDADVVLALLQEDCVVAAEDEVIVNPNRLRGSNTPKLIEEVELHYSATLPPEWDELLKRVVFVSPRAASSPIHGERHWRRVAEVGLELAHETPGADERVAFAFALLHDSKRENEDDDPGHGERASRFARELHAEGILDLDAGQLKKLVLACRTHTDGTTSTDATVDVCFDADRLDLGRVGLEPDPKLMSTDAGRKRARALGRG